MLTITVTCPLFLFDCLDCNADGQNILFSDGEFVNQIAASKDVRTLWFFLFFNIEMCLDKVSLYFSFNNH